MLHVVKTGHRGTKGYRFSYLQESEDIKTEIQQLEDPNNPEPLIDLAFCRLFRDSCEIKRASVVHFYSAIYTFGFELCIVFSSYSQRI